MFSSWLVKLKGIDIRKYGDGNPGAVNAFGAGGWKLGVPAMLLDFGKGFIPVFIACHYLGINDYRIVPIAIAPVFGHAFSPFLKFQGGKAIATTFGIWTALTLWQVPVVLGLALILFKVILRLKNDAWCTILGMVCILIFLLVRYPNAIFLSIFFFNFLIVVYKHRSELRLIRIIR